MLRDYFYSYDGKRLMCDTRFVPFPIGRNNYETAVFRATKNGCIQKPSEPVEIVTSGNEPDAIETHANMVSKWSKNNIY